MLIDNSLSEEVEVKIGSCEPILLPPQTNRGVKIEEGRYTIEVISLGLEDQQQEKFVINAMQKIDINGNEKDGYYVYNIGGRNSYSFSTALYGPEIKE